MTEHERKIPIRTCVSCRQSSEKKLLVRIVRTASGDVVIDRTGKLSGRGAYLCGSKECVASAIKANKLGRALRCEIPEQIKDEIKRLGDDGNEQDVEEDMVYES